MERSNTLRSRSPRRKLEDEALEKEEYDDNDYDDAEDDYESGKRSGKKKKHGAGRGLTIAALLGGTVLLVVLVVVLGRAAGLFGTGSSKSNKAEQKQKASASDSMATVPDLVGKTEDEAKALANDAHLGVQMAGEEASDQEKRQDFRQETAQELRLRNIQQ